MLPKSDVCLDLYSWDVNVEHGDDDFDRSEHVELEGESENSDEEEASKPMPPVIVSNVCTVVLPLAYEPWST